MSIEKILYLSRNKAKYIILIGALLGAVSFCFLVFTQKNFKTSIDLLITQNQEGFSDYYALSKSADYLSGIIVESIYSEKFLDEMSQSGLNLNEFLPTDNVKRLNEWSKTIKVNKNPNLAMINVKIYNNSQKQAMEISRAVMDVLINKNSLFLGKGQAVEIRVLSGPIWEKNPSLENLIVAVLGGFGVGVILSFAFFYYKEEKYASELHLEELRRKISESENFYQ